MCELLNTEICCFSADIVWWIKKNGCHIAQSPSWHSHSDAQQYYIRIHWYIWCTANGQT